MTRLPKALREAILFIVTHHAFTIAAPVIVMLVALAVHLMLASDRVEN
jgi:hypothetical protein